MERLSNHQWPPNVELADDQTIAIYKSMTPMERLAGASQMTVYLKKWTMRRLQELHPDWTDDRAETEWRIWVLQDRKDLIPEAYGKADDTGQLGYEIRWRDRTYLIPHAEIHNPPR